MQAQDFALVHGYQRTRETLDRWGDHPGPVVRSWFLGAGAIAALLLASVLVVAHFSTPDSTKVTLAGLNSPATVGAVVEILRRNALVLALHSFACVAGFIAGSSLPAESERHTGFVRAVHDRAGPLAIAFVVCATTFSLVTQAYALGNSASTLAAQGGIPVWLLLVGILPHAIPELLALFLPLAAWMLASRRGDWHELLAATLVTTSIAAPMLVTAAFLEVYVSPHLILLLRG